VIEVKRGRPNVHERQRESGFQGLEVVIAEIVSEVLNLRKGRSV
jgi:hypothetical protein